MKLSTHDLLVILDALEDELIILQAQFWTRKADDERDKVKLKINEITKTKAKIYLIAKEYLR